MEVLRMLAGRIYFPHASFKGKVVGSGLRRFPREKESGRKKDPEFF